MLYNTCVDYTSYKPIKNLGQNFLIDFEYAYIMLDALQIEDGDLIVEIGPGLGALTDDLAARIRDTNTIAHAVDVDSRFVGKLNAMYLDNLNINLITADILEWLPQFNPEKDFKVVGSLPYYITSPILHAIVKHPKRPKIAVLLVQKEVAQKIVQQAPDASYLSVFAGTFYDCQLITNVPKEKFSPSPKVDGGIIKLVRKENIMIANEDVLRYEDFLHKGFSKPRKMLNKVFAKDKLVSLGIDDTLRPQHLQLEDWYKLFFNTDF